MAVSYSAACILPTSESTISYREALELMIAELENSGKRVYLAPREEKWGAERPARAVGIERDFVALRTARDFLLFLDGKESDGALVELGAAVALEKRIWLLRRPTEDLPSYVTGFMGRINVKYRTVGEREDFTRLARELILAMD